MCIIMISSGDNGPLQIVILLLIASFSCTSSDFKTLPSPNSSLYDNDDNYKYTVTIDPERENATVDDKLCHPDAPVIVCKTLNHAFEQFDGFSDVKFYLSAPNLTYQLGLRPNFTKVNRIGIFGNGSLYPVVPMPTVECESGVGLAFINSNNIVLDSVQFLKCGAPQLTTSKDFSKQTLTASMDTSMLVINVGLYFYNCTTIFMHRVSVLNGSQSAGVVMYDVDGHVEVSSCSFTGNRATISQHCSGHYGGGAFYVEFPYCRPGDHECTDNNYNINERRRNKNSTYLFLNSSFDRNFACGQNVTDRGIRLLSSNSSHQAVGRGGGLSVFFKGDAQNNNVTIINCSFVDNHAVWGAGLHIEMQDNAVGNAVKISDCLVHHNHAFFTAELGTGGGGLLVQISTYLWPHYQTGLNVSNSSISRVHIEDSDFSRNHGLQGGAISFILCRQSRDCRSKVSIFRCLFDENRAQLGTAVYAKLFPVLIEGYLPQIVLSGCSFTNNSIKYENKILHTVGIGTVYANQVSVAFRDQVQFLNNSGSALGVVGAQINFTDTNGLFFNNSGLLGAGIALLGTASILVGEKTTLSFIANRAEQHGGAIFKQYIVREDLSSDTDCFIHYSRPFLEPQNWTASFLFYHNTAGMLGNAIFSSAILPCSYGTADPKDILCWNEKHWDYGGSNCTDQIRTKPQKFSRDGKSLRTPISVYPGLQYQLPLSAFDDLGNDVSRDIVYYAFVQNSSEAKVEPGFNHVASNYISITGRSGEKDISLVMQTEDSRLMHVKLNVSLSQCPPGFTEVGNQCTCSQSNYGDSMKCFEKELKSYIQVDKWLGELEEDDHNLYMGTIPSDYRLPNKDSFKPLPSNRSELDRTLCGNVNRTGVLCGECLPGYAVAVNSPNYKCVPCDILPTRTFVGNLFSYIALTYGTVFILFLAIIFLNFKLTSSAAMGFVLYAQMVGSETFSLTASGVLSNKIYQNVETAYKTVYGIFNLNSLSFLMKPFCLNRHFNTLDVICLDYAIAAFPLIMIAFIYCTLRCMSRFHCSRRRRRLTNPATSFHSQNQQQQKMSANNLVHAFSAFMFLSYTKFCLASMKTMSMYVMYNETEQYKERRITLAGQWKPSDRQFLFPYGIIAIFVFIVAVLLPPFLLLGPIQIIDLLIEKPRFQFLRRIWPSIAVHTILDTFQGFYRPGCRFFGGVFVLFRLVVFIAYSFEVTIDQQYAIQQIAMVVLICLIALFRPYSEDFYNHVNILIFLNLSILNTFAAFMYADSTKHFSSKIYTLQCILVWIPLIYIICYAIWRRVHDKKPYQMVKSKMKKQLRLRLVSFASPRSEGASKDESEQLNQDGPYNDSAPLDEDADIFQRAASKNCYRRLVPGRGSTSSVTYSEVGPPFFPENEPQPDEDRSTGDSGAGTGTGTSSGVDTK